MKKKILLIALLALALLFGFVGCGGPEEPPEPSYDPTKDPDAAPYLELAEYYEECENGGTIETLTYNVEMYAVELKEGLPAGSRFEDKELYVYLPYGYDESEQYDILYLLHGSNETVDYWFYTQKTVTPYYCTVMQISDPLYKMNYTKNVLDNLIAQGKCDPVIVVTPSYHSATVSEYAYGSTTEDRQFWLETFETELRNDIIPLVESRYSTYADGDVSAEGLKASRDHRALAGFSKGARFTSGYAMNSMLDVFSEFGCFHGCATDAETLADSMGAAPDCPVNYLYFGTGEADIGYYEGVRDMDSSIRTLLSDVFTEGENYTYFCKPQGGHFYDSALLDLYNLMQILYGEGEAF